MYNKKGFTLIELMVVVAIIGVLASVLYASFEDSREQARDRVRSAELKELQMAIELYRAQNGQYPAAGCGASTLQFAGPGPASVSGFRACPPGNPLYILGLVPDFIPALPRDPRFESEANRGFYYRSDGDSYKLMLHDVVESLTVDSFDHEFARCPRQMASGPCSGATPPPNTYAVYSAGAESW